MHKLSHIYCVGASLLPDPIKESDRLIMASHINWIDDNHFTLHLNASKTDPFRQGSTIHYFANNSITCPVRALRSLLSVHIPEQPLFAMGGPAVTFGYPLTRTSYINWLHTTLDIINNEHKLGINHADYSGHSLRRGGATSLFYVAYLNKRLKY
jgi:hypothetical protein